MSSLWYEGDIAQAVNKAKGLGAFFVVFIEGQDETSQTYSDFFKNENILNQLRTSHFVAIKVEDQSITHTQFSAIYPQTPVPSVYFIDKHGKPVEIISGHITDEEFNNKVRQLIEKNNIQANPSTFSQNLIQHEQASGSQSNATNIQLDVKLSSEENAEAVVIPEEGETLSAEEKIKRAQELLKQKQDLKKKEEEEIERLKEIERRKMGQSVQQMKKWQQDEELKHILEERQKEKRENQEARDRVLAQIAQDKAERAARFSNSTTTQPQPSPPQTSRFQPKSNVSRLQFRLPDGGSHTHEFIPSDLLEAVHEYIRNNISLPFSNYTLSTTFPRREFTVNDNVQTLLDLQLVPNAVILILPVNQGIVQRSSGGPIGSLIWWLLTPIFQVYNTITGYFTGRPSTPNPPNSESTTSVKRTIENDESERRLPKKKASESAVIRRQGNIHRLRDRPDSDDENNTWNGNSTQQM